MLEGLLRPTHLLVILALVIVLFGPRRFPEFGKALGDGLKGLRSIFQSRDVSPENAQNDRRSRPEGHVKGLLRDSDRSDPKS